MIHPISIVLVCIIWLNTVESLTTKINSIVKCKYLSLSMSSEVKSYDLQNPSVYYQLTNIFGRLAEHKALGFTSSYSVRYYIER